MHLSGLNLNPLSYIQFKIKMLHFDIYRVIKPLEEAKCQWETLKFHEALIALIWKILVTITGFFNL